jgi:glutamyl-tRNA reductase
MQLALVGVSHKTAPVEIRERLAFNSDALRQALQSLIGRRDVTEAIILSTCNRVEVVAESPDDRLIREFLCGFLRTLFPGIFTAIGMSTRSGTFSV